MEQSEEHVQQIQQHQEIKQKASRLRMLFKIAFICNIFFLMCIIMRYTTAPGYLPQFIIELSLLLGWPAIILNVINFVLALLLLSRIRKRQVPLWLLYTNIIFFLI